MTDHRVCCCIDKPVPVGHCNECEANPGLCSTSVHLSVTNFSAYVDYESGPRVVAINSLEQDDNSAGCNWSGGINQVYDIQRGLVNEPCPGVFTGGNANFVSASGECVFGGIWRLDIQIGFLNFPHAVFRFLSQPTDCPPGPYEFFGPGQFQGSNDYGPDILKLCDGGSVVVS